MSCRLDLAVRVRHRGEQLAKLISHIEPAFANGEWPPRSLLCDLSGPVPHKNEHGLDSLMKEFGASH